MIASIVTDLAPFLILGSALIGATGTIIAAIIMSQRGANKKLDDIHLLVNARLTDALTEISLLRDYIDREANKMGYVSSQNLVPRVIGAPTEQDILDHTVGSLDPKTYYDTN